MTNLSICAQNSLSQEIIDVIQYLKTYTFEENSGNGMHHNKKYKIDIEIPKEWQQDKILVIKNLEKVKAQIPYLVQQPKDCDYIMINPEKRVVLFFELKDTAETAEHVGQQLISGKWWAEHLIFCSNYFINDDYFNGAFFNDTIWTIKYAELKFRQKGRMIRRNAKNFRKYRNFKYLLKECNSFSISDLLNFN